jgi:hypothetical protein
VSQNDPAPLLGEWCDSARRVEILFSDASNKGWRRNGKISYVGFAEFEISWDEGGSQVFKYDVLTTLDGRQLRFTYPSGDEVVVHEVAP